MTETLEAANVANPMRRSKSEIKTEQMKYICDGFSPEALDWRKPDWVVLGWMAAMHAGCLLAPFYFSWTGVAIACVMHFLTACVGVTLGYHRYLAHRSFKLSRPAQFFVYLCGVSSGEGTPLRWAATHRLHHARSDHEGDPHSPKDGSLWSHILWIFVRREPKFDDVLYRRFVPDLVDDPLLRFFEKTFFGWLVAFGVAAYLIGGMPALIWGMCVRMVVVYHGTWFVNSATHLWGYRNYETTDESKNLWWVGIIAYGEGWHNNHHAFPALARAGHRWWELDITFWVIRALQLTGLAWDIKDRVPAPTEKNQAVAKLGLEMGTRPAHAGSNHPGLPTPASTLPARAAATLIPATAAAVAVMPVVDIVAGK